MAVNLLRSACRWSCPKAAVSSQGVVAYLDAQIQVAGGPTEVVLADVLGVFGRFVCALVFLAPYFF